MNKYLNLYSYKNAQTPDLWACLEEAAQKPVSKVKKDKFLYKSYQILHKSY